MPTTRAQLFARFAQLGIKTTTHEHAPVFSVDEARTHCAHLPGGHCKSLFLKDKKAALYLVVCLDETRVELKQLAKTLGAARFSFAHPDLLMEVLGVAVGAVSPFALINDTSRRVQPLLESTMMAHQLLNYHPLSNTATTVIKNQDLLRFIESCGHRPQILDLTRTS